jgi:hypothetical protein
MFNRDDVPLDERERLYRRLLKEHAESGLTLREFGKRQGIPSGTLSCWRHKLKQRDQRDEGVQRPTAPRSLLVPVTIRQEPPTEESHGYEVLLRCGRVVRLSGGFKPEALTAIVRAVEAAC